MNLDKEILSSAAAYIIGLSPMTKVKGSSLEIQVFSEVLESSRSVYQRLCEVSTIDDVSEALAIKSEKAKVFKEVFGRSWPF